MKEYRGVKYFFDDKDSLWKIVLKNGGFFVVALDDSKLCGYRRIVEEYNTEKSCKEYIDWILSKSHHI